MILAENLKKGKMPENLQIKFNALAKSARSASPKKKIIFLIIFLATAFLVYWFFIRDTGPKGIITDKVQKATITQTVSETGNIESAATAVTSPSTGFVEEVLIKNGDSVIPGDQLVKIKSSASEQDKQAALSDYLTAKSALDAASSTAHSLRGTMYTNWKTYLDMAKSSQYENGDGTPKTQAREAAEFQTAQENWLSAEAKYKDQQNVISQTRAKVSSTWLAYQATQNATVKAQASGTVANLSVSPSSGIKAANAILSIVSAQTTNIIKVAIAETDIPQVAVGQKAQIKVDAIGDKTFDGKVDRVDEVGTNTQGVITYNVYVRLDNSPQEAKPEMTATVKIETETRDNVLSVPNSAVKPYEGGRALRILDKKTKQIKFLPVQIGIRGDKRTEILEGASEGLEIIVALENEGVKRKSPLGF